MKMLSWGVLLCAMSFAVSAATPAPDAITQCDRLASHPEDPDHIAPGVPSSKVDLPKAVAACEAELKRQPDNLRIRYQYARALAYSGQSKLATEQMRIAADGGYRQAQFVFGLFVDRNRPDAPTDVCLAEQYFLKAARGGRQAARVIYVHHVLNGRFDACRIEAAPGDLKQLLDDAAANASEFYERLLIGELKGRLAARSQS